MFEVKKLKEEKKIGNRSGKKVTFTVSRWEWGEGQGEGAVVRKTLVPEGRGKKFMKHVGGRKGEIPTLSKVRVRK